MESKLGRGLVPGEHSTARRGLCTVEKMNYVPVSSESKSVLPRTLPGTLTVVDARVCKSLGSESD